VTVVAVASDENGRIAVTVDVVGGTARRVGVRVFPGPAGFLAATATLIDGSTVRWPSSGSRAIGADVPYAEDAPIPAALRFPVDPWPEAVSVRLQWAPAPV
jgi:hypothetical protein